VPQSYYNFVSSFNAGTKVWQDIAGISLGASYTFADFVDSLGKLVIVDATEVRTVDPETGI